MLLLLLCLAACQRGSGQTAADGTATLPPLPTPPTPVLEEDPIGGEVGESPAPEGGEPAPLEPGFAGRFSNLRFAASRNGEAQSSFPTGTQEIYAIWDYDGMSASDTVERLWYLNDQQQYERREVWNYLENGSTGAVRNICIYDYIDGIDPGQWKLVVYLNGELQLEGQFTVGDPASGAVSPLPDDQQSCIDFY